MIECEVLDYDKKAFNVSNHYDVDQNARVWPCCIFVSAWFKYSQGLPVQEEESLANDPILQELLQQDPDWNSLEKHSFEDIIKNDFFTQYINQTGWNSDRPPPLCKAFCDK